MNLRKSKGGHQGADPDYAMQAQLLQATLTNIGKVLDYLNILDKIRRFSAINIILVCLSLFLAQSLAFAQSSSGLKGGSSQDYDIVAGAIGTEEGKGSSSLFNVTIHGNQQPYGIGNSSGFNVSLGYLYSLDSSPPGTIILFPTNHLVTNKQPLPLNITFFLGVGLSPTIYYYVNGALNQTSTTNTTLNASDGNYQINVSVFDGASFSRNATVNVTIDTIRPRINSSINNTSPRINWTVNITANVSDSWELSKCQFIANQSGVQFFNQTITGRDKQCSQNFTIAKGRANVLNFTVIVFDTANNTNQSEHIITIANTPPPKIYTIYPSIHNFTTNRTPEFAWYNVTDADLDPITFTLNITCVLCSSDNRLINTTEINHTISFPLQRLGDDGFFYNWTVAASDGVVYGTSSNVSNITINSFVSLRLITSTVDFSTMLLGEENSTHDNLPGPFVLENDGNVFVNVSIAANQSLWATQSIPNASFQYKIDNTSKLFSFDYFNLNSTINWTNITLIDSLSVVNLSYMDQNDTVEIDIKVRVPTDEIPGAKQSKIILGARY